MLLTVYLTIGTLTLFSLRQGHMYFRFLLLLVLFYPSLSHCAISSILAVEGYACNKNKSNGQTRKQAYINAKHKALNTVKKYISLNSIKDIELKNYVVDAFSSTEVKIISVLAEHWDEKLTCVTVSIQAEVVPFFKNTQIESVFKKLMVDPLAPLTIKMWTNKKEFLAGDIMRVYIKANKPFYGLLTYRDASQNLLQILPNPNRTSSYFSGETTHTIPSTGDKFELIIEPPFGEEFLSLYASTQPLGNINKIAIGPAYQLKDTDQQIAEKTRGLALKLIKRDSIKNINKSESIAEFNQVSVKLMTMNE
ncbi:MAG: DUF4384 domain-containing protein [Reichenbachiella sp.]